MKFTIRTAICLVWLSFSATLSAVEDAVDTSMSDSTLVENLSVSFLSKPYARVCGKPFELLVYAENIVGHPIDSAVFKLSDANDKPVVDSNTVIHTNEKGIAVAYLGPFHKPGIYSFRLEGNTISEDFSITVRQKNWALMLVIGLLGGLSLFLYGMGLLSNGLQNSAGSKMRNILERLTVNRFMAVGIGALITTVIQSSSATNVMLVSFVNSRLMKFKQTIGIILGAAIGTTITAQIIAFKLTDFALVFVSLGLILYLLSKKERLNDIALSVLGFGILFYGMHIMSESMLPLRSFQPFIDIIVSLENPVLGILVGTLFTALIQSSSASIGILIVLSMQGLLSLNASVSLIIGANIGTAITAILASINTSREAKQVAVAHTFIKVIGASIVLLFHPMFIQLVNSTTVSDISGSASPRQIAHTHTIFNVFLFVLFIPFTKTIARIVNKIYPLKEDHRKEFRLNYINESLLSVPDLALDAARKEIVEMMQVVEGMFTKILKPFLTKQINIREIIQQKEVNVNLWRDELSEFLVNLSQRERSKGQIEETFILLNAIKEFEQIADVISSQLLSKAENWCSSSYEFSESGKQELVEYHKMTKKIIHKAIKVFKDFDIEKAQKLKTSYYSYRDEYFALERQHYDRLSEKVEASLLSSKTHLELITMFRVISSHATNTARTILYRKEKKKKRKNK